MILWGGQGRSLELNCLVDRYPRPVLLSVSIRPAMVDNSPGEKVSMVVETVELPHTSFANRLVNCA